MNFEADSKFLLESSNKHDHKFEEISSFLQYRSANPNHLDLFFQKNDSIMMADEHSTHTNRGILITLPPSTNTINEISRSLISSKQKESKDTLSVSAPATQSAETRTRTKRQAKNKILSTSESDPTTAEQLIQKPVVKGMSSMTKKIKNKSEKLLPKSNQTQGLMMKLNNYPRLEIKISKNCYLKKVVNFLKEKWFGNLDGTTRSRLDLTLYPEPEKWLKHIQNFNFLTNSQNTNEINKLADHYLVSDVISGYNAAQCRAIFLNYEIEEIKKPSLINKSTLESGVEANKISFWNNGGENRPNAIKPIREVVTLQQQVMQIEEPRKESISLSSRNEERNPYIAMKFFETARRSNSKSLDEPNKEAGLGTNHANGINTENKSNNNSIFSFTEQKGAALEKQNEPMRVEPEKSANVNSNRSFRSKNDNSVEAIYNLLNRQFPEQSTFVSKLTDDGYSPSKLANINKIQIKKKTTATFEGLEDGKSSFSEGKPATDSGNVKTENLSSKQSQLTKPE